MSASAKNMEVVVKAKQVHNETCPWKKPAIRICMHPFDINRMGWEEGDIISELWLIADTSVTTGMLRIECEGDIDSSEPDITEAVSNKELIPA